MGCSNRDIVILTTSQVPSILLTTILLIRGLVQGKTISLTRSNLIMRKDE